MIIRRSQQGQCWADLAVYLQLNVWLEVGAIYRMRGNWEVGTL